MHCRYLIFASLPLLAAAAPEIRAVTNPTVSIPNGTVIGTATRVSNQPSVTGLASAYLGVPFASSPPLRFAPPTPPQSWTSPLVAQTPPKACFQNYGDGATNAKAKYVFNDFPGAPPGESEDCLYLNIFAPSGASKTKLKPVMFWIYGGNLQTGAASLGAYNGSSLAVNEDVVVVVPNYRTNFFGFSNSPQIPHGQQNSGFLDQRQALQWVQENIQYFGGNASQVTLFGESAGGYSIKQLLAQPPTLPPGGPSRYPFRAAIMESPGFGISGDSATNYKNVSDHFNCSTASSTIDCLRTKNATDLSSYVNSKGLAFGPVEDQTSVASHSLPEIQSGEFANVPLLIGNNLDEDSIFLYIAGLPNSESVIQQVSEVSGINVSSIYQYLLGNYSSAIDNNEYTLLVRVLTDLTFTCPIHYFSQAVASTGRQPVWRYRYDANFTNLEFGDPRLGAYHSSEIPSVFGTYPSSNQYGKATSNQIKLSAYVQHTWANFAKNPTAGPGWPQLTSNPAGVELGVLGGPSNLTGETTVAKTDSDYPCPAYYPLLLINGDLY